MHDTWFLHWNFYRASVDSNLPESFIVATLQFGLGTTKQGRATHLDFFSRWLRFLSLPFCGDILFVDQ